MSVFTKLGTMHNIQHVVDICIIIVDYKNNAMKLSVRPSASYR